MGRTGMFVLLPRVGRASEFNFEAPPVFWIPHLTTLQGHEAQRTAAIQQQSWNFILETQKMGGSLFWMSRITSYHLI